MLFTGVIAPKLTKMGTIGSIVLPLGKVVNNKYTEAETWHPERVEEWSYFRLCD